MRHICERTENSSLIGSPQHIETEWTGTRTTRASNKSEKRMLQTSTSWRLSTDESAAYRQSRIGDGYLEDIFEVANDRVPEFAAHGDGDAVAPALPEEHLFAVRHLRPAVQQTVGSTLSGSCMNTNKDIVVFTRHVQRDKEEMWWNFTLKFYSCNWNEGSHLQQYKAGQERNMCDASILTNGILNHKPECYLWKWGNWIKWADDKL